MENSNNNFAHNLQFLRTRQGMSQEALAEQLSVSRQSVSKWESGAAYPEMTTLLTLCDLFHLDLDTLLRGSADAALATDAAGYDEHMNRFSAFIAGGVALILFGVGLMIGVGGIFEAKHLPQTLEGIIPAILLLCVLISTVLFIVSGIRNDNFRKKNPRLPDFYPAAQREQFSRRFVWLIACPVAAILADVILLVVLGDWAESTGREHMLLMLFMWVLAGAVGTLVWGGIQTDKFDLHKYNLENTPEMKKISDISGGICGVIMLAATAIYLYTGFARNAWGTTYWVFPIGGLLCAIASSIVASACKELKAQAEERLKEK